MTDYSDTLEILKLHQHCGPGAEIGNCLFCAAKDAIETLQAENSRLQEALTFYAATKSWVSVPPLVCVARIDRGGIARAALKGETT